MTHWTDQEIDEMNQAALIEREKFPPRLAQFYESWDELFADIDDGRCWRSQQPARRTPGGYSADLRLAPAVMVFVR